MENNAGKENESDYQWRPLIRKDVTALVAFHARPVLYMVVYCRFAY